MKRRHLLGAVAAVASVLTLAVAASVAFLQNAPLPAQSSAQAAGTAKATFAGGCFWCVEADFDKVPGVISTTSGYIGGTVANPSYEQVSAKTTGHAEAVEIVFDPAKVSFEQLLEKFWRTIDPTTKDRQFCDAGSPYRTAIFTHGAQQAAAAQASKAALDKSKTSRRLSSPRSKLRGRSIRLRVTTRTTTRRIRCATTTTAVPAGAMRG